MKTLAVALLLSMVWIGCSSDGSQSRSVKVGDPVGSLDDVAGPADRAIDPVSGTEVRKDSSWTCFHDGYWYYFTSEENRKRFLSDPTAFVTEDGRMKHDLEAK